MYPPQTLAFIDEPMLQTYETTDLLPHLEEEFLGAVRAGNRDRTLRLLRLAPELVHTVNSEGRTPLHLAALNRNAEMAQLLLARGADVNARTLTGVTPLHLASQRGHSLMVGLLLSLGAEATVKDVWGNTPRERALENGHRSIARMLAGLPARREEVDRGGRRPRSRERNRPARRLLPRLRRNAARAAK